MDRIFDAYNGIGGFSMEFMRKTRERMNWICEQVSGASVLDVGCSQGVGPILLGQAGFTVLGLDINADAVAFANEKLLAEDESVRKAVQFAQGNFATFDFGGRRFDNVIFGEVLEHLFACTQNGKLTAQIQHFLCLSRGEYSFRPCARNLQ